MSNQRTRWNGTVLLCCGLAMSAAACAPAEPPPQDNIRTDSVTGPWNRPALHSDFVINNEGWWENTMAAIPPHTNWYCWGKGALVMSFGQNFAATVFGSIMSRPLYQPNGATLDTTTIQKSFLWPNLTSQEAMTSTDNQIVRRSDGTLVAAHIAKTWAPMNPAPSWANTLVSYGGPSQVKGARNELLFEESVDCGQTWQRFGTLDAGTVANGQYGAPQTAKGNPPPWVGGWDRPELYADPFSNWMFVSTDGDHDTTSDGLLLGAPNGNAYGNPDLNTWQVLAKIPANPPYVMTTTPNKRFYAFTCNGNPTLWYATDPNNPASLTSVDLRAQNGNVKPCAFDPNIDIRQNTELVAIARAHAPGAPSRVDVYYPALASSGLQVISQVRVTINDANPSSVTISPQPDTFAADSQHSATFATVIEPDYVNMPSSYAGNNSLPYLLYWVEGTTKSNGNSDPSPNVCVRYSVRTGDAEVLLTPNYPVTGPDGKPVCFNISNGYAPGDYMKGAFMWDKHRLTFVPEWLDNSSNIQTSIIRVSPVAKVVSQLGVPGDVDGNGAADIIALNGSSATVALSNADSTFTVGPTGATSVGSTWPTVTGDFNGDGITDMLTSPHNGTHGMIIALGKGDGTFNTVTSTSDLTPWTNQSGAVLYAGDFDGDGLTDLAVVGVSWWNSIAVGINNGDASHTFKILNVLNNSSDAFFAVVAGQTGAKVVVGDFDGDGLDDLAATGGTQPNGQPWQTIPVAFSIGNGTFRTTNYYSTFQQFSGVDVARVYAGDFNGDGRSDLAVLQVWPGGTGTIPMAWSKGDGTFSVVNVANDSGSQFFSAVAGQPYAQTVVGDFNGDGLDDFAATGGEQYLYGPQWNTLPVALSNGNGTFYSYNPSSTFQSYTQLFSSTVLSSWK